jgi:hypothetical protein
MYVVNCIIGATLNNISYIYEQNFQITALFPRIFACLKYKI